MTSHFNWLEISKPIQDLFVDFYSIDESKNLLFPYGNDKFEVFGFNKQIIPRNAMPWKALNCHLSNVSTVYLFESAVEAICFAQYKHSLTASWSIDNSIFLSLGKQPSSRALEWIKQNLPKRFFVFVFPNTLIGKVMDCKMAAFLSGKELKITHDHEYVYLDYRDETYSFSTDKFSLARVKKVTGIQNRIGKAEKAPAPFSTFKDYIFSKKNT